MNKNTKKRLQTSMDSDYIVLLKYLAQEAGMTQADILEQAIGNWCTSYMNLNAKSKLNSDIGEYQYPCLGSAIETARKHINT